MLFCYRDEYYLEREKPQKAEAIEAWQASLDRARNRMEIIVAKQRQGEVRTAHVRFAAATNMIWEIAMSVKLMAKIWDDGPEGQGERFVLLALADYANNAGECWPALASVARKCCLTDRGVEKILRRLNNGGSKRRSVGAVTGVANTR